MTMMKDGYKSESHGLIAVYPTICQTPLLHCTLPHHHIFHPLKHMSSCLPLRCSTPEMPVSRGRSSTERSTPPRPTNPNQPPQLACESGHDPEADNIESLSICTTSTRDASTDRSMAISSLWSVLADVAGYWRSVSSRSSSFHNNLPSVHSGFSCFPLCCKTGSTF